MRPTFTQNPDMNLKLNIQWALGEAPADAIEPLVFELLSAIEQGQSLRSAAETCGASYRHAWGLMREWEQRFGAPLLELQRGRGAELSAVGRCLLWAQRRAEARLSPALDSLSAEVANELGSLLDQSTPVRLVASHDLALDQVRARLAAVSQHTFSVQYRGSLDAVRQLIAGNCDLAGYHVPHWSSLTAIRTRFDQLLPGKEFCSIHFADRSQGLILGAGNPAMVASLQDLAQSGLRFVNRQAGSGTRLLFDELLSDAGIPKSGISGYELEEFTHMAVAAMIASGAADAGFGIQAAAERFGLAFVPLVQEHYLLAFRADRKKQDWVQMLISLLKTDQDLRAAVNALPGYECDRMGAELGR